MKSIITLTIIFFISSCSLFERSHYQVMEENKADFFVADRDFPMVSGDTGQAYRTKKQVWNRTPGSVKFRKKEMQNILIMQELSKLERMQSDESYKHYREYKNDFTSNSEKIFFLKLRTLKEREEYLFSRGLNKSSTSPEENEAVRQREIIIGMTKHSVVQSWGRPNRVDIAGNPRYENERWAYLKRGKLNYIYFESGHVQGWKMQ
jgi:hypothetical protein